MVYNSWHKNLGGVSTLFHGRGCHLRRSLNRNSLMFIKSNKSHHYNGKWVIGGTKILDVICNGWEKFPSICTYVHLTGHHCYIYIYLQQFTSGWRLGVAGEELPPSLTLLAYISLGESIFWKISICIKHCFNITVAGLQGFLLLLPSNLGLYSLSIPAAVTTATTTSSPSSSSYNSIIDSKCLLHWSLLSF